MNQLYPLKFKSGYKSYLWGGTRLESSLGKKIPGHPTAESWEISGLQGSLSVVSNGFLKGNNIQELVEVYMGELVGEKVFERFGLEFPLLIKFLDAHDNLSVQVHPDDELARSRHNAYGKTEMWYVLEADPGATLISGFSKPVTREEYIEACSSNKLLSLLNQVEVQAGDVFFIPAGRIHAIGKGLLVAEIQQTSDITYRIYDWDRTDAKGKARELHTSLSLDAINFAYARNVKSAYTPALNKPVSLARCPYFSTSRLDLTEPFEPDYDLVDSFIIYICTSGSCAVHYAKGEEPVSLKRGESMLVPADLREIRIVPEPHTSLLEVYIP